MGSHVTSAVCLWIALPALLAADPPGLPGRSSPPLAVAVPPRSAYSWQQPHAKVLATGDLEWQPEPFVFSAGPSRRYIDHQAGSDANDGLSPATAWKHHPWDANARGQAAVCRGIHTYVFRRGTVYRGSLKAAESGEPGNPIRLTSDPEWGQGEAAIYGSVHLEGAWTRGADHPDIPEPDRVWYRDLDFAPRNVWMVAADGAVVRIPLARTPNWKVSDPDDVKSEWWHWNYPEGRPFDVTTETPDGRRFNLGIDTENLTRERAYYEDAIVWTEYGWVQSTPYPTRVMVVDTERRGLGFGGQWGDSIGSYKIVKWCRYFLEDKPHYLDDPDGEFWFDKRGDGGRLYLRLPGGADPNLTVVEAARHDNLIDGQQVSHLHVSGLTFRFTNVFWDLTATEYRTGGDFAKRFELNPACVRVVGSGTDISVRHCRFEHTYMAVYLKAHAKGEVLDRIEIADNTIAYTDGGGIVVAEGPEWGHRMSLDFGLLKDVKVLRNRLHEIGRRPSRYGMGVAIDLFNGETVEVAGNILTRCWGLGINMPGGKRSGASWDVPLVRVLCHHNKVIDPLLNNNDFGGIETWQGGPFYVYNNVVGNPGGYQNYHHGLRPDGYKRFGHAYYLDGAYKNYLFNNIGWGKSAAPADRLGARSAIQEIHSFQNTFFNNTFSTFVKGSRRQAPQGGRNQYLGNIWDTIGDWVFRHADPARSQAAGNEADAGRPASQFMLNTNAYSRNVFHNVARYAVLKPSGQWHESFAEAQAVMQEAGMMPADMGVVAETPTLRDAASHDFRPAPGSAATGLGVRVFVPWGLSRTVGEWNFCPIGNDPTLLLDEHWYMTPYYLAREGYPHQPRFHLRGVGITADDFIPGPLEDWTRGALRLNGRDQYALAANAPMNGPHAYTVVGAWAQQGQREERIADGEDFRSPQVHTTSFLIEAVLMVAPGHVGGVVVEKRLAEVGYSLAVDDTGRMVFAITGGGRQARVTSTVAVNTGEWLHIIAEADRPAFGLRLAVNGKPDAVAPGLGSDVSLANPGDLTVGGTPQGRCLAGAIDFLRIALGTLAEARTTLEELAAWQFDGPFRRDFAGRAPDGRRTAGALDSVEP